MEPIGRYWQSLFVAGLAVVVAAVSLVVVGGGHAEATTAEPQDCLRLAFIGEDDEFALDEQVFVTDLSGERRVRVTAPTANDVLGDKFESFAWLPDGRLIVGIPFGTGFYVMDAVGGNIEVFSSPSGQELAGFSPSPDGSRVAAYGYDDVIEVIAIDGSPASPVTISPASSSAVWSPDGSQIAWFNYAAAGSSIMVADADGQNPSPIGTNDANGTPSWSPDGLAIIWSDVDGNIEIISPDGTGQTTLVPTDGLIARSVQWSPDGNRLAWAGYGDSDEGTIFVADSDGGDKTPVGTGGGPSWSPGSTFLAWSTDYQIIVANADGSDARDITEPGPDPDPHLVGSPEFSPCVFEAPSGPANDDFAFATPLQSSQPYGVDFEATATGTNVDASGESGEPDHRVVDGPFASVWYRFIAPTSGYIQVDTFGSSFDTVLAVYTGSSVDGLTEVAANDDAGVGLESRVRFPTSAGMTYHIAVDGVGNDQVGDVELRVGPAIFELDECDIVGTAGRDILMGTEGDDVICGLGGADSISGKGGNDIIVGGPGNDRVWAGTGADIVLGQNGNDRIIAGSGDDLVIGGEGDDRVFARTGNDVISTGGGDDRVYGEDGHDEIAGGGGADKLVGGPGNDYLNGGPGSDVCNAGSGSDTVFNC